MDPTDAIFLSNRSLCWLRLGQAEHALADAKACRALRPDWPKACFREGAALRLMQACTHFPIKQLMIFIAKKERPNAMKYFLYYCRSLMKQPIVFMRVCSWTPKVRNLSMLSGWCQFRFKFTLSIFLFLTYCVVMLCKTKSKMHIVLLVLRKKKGSV